MIAQGHDVVEAGHLKGVMHVTVDGHDGLTADDKDQAAFAIENGFADLVPAKIHVYFGETTTTVDLYNHRDDLIASGTSHLNGDDTWLAAEGLAYAAKHAFARVAGRYGVAAKNITDLKQNPLSAILTLLGGHDKQ